MDKILKGKYTSYNIELSGYVSVWVDNYKDGEVRYGINGWGLKKQTITIPKLNKINLVKVRKFVLDYLNKQLYEKISTYKFRKEVDILDNIQYSQYTNEHNIGTPSKDDFIEWKKGNKDLFVQDISIYVKINGVDVTEDDLRTIVNI